MPMDGVNSTIKIPVGPYVVEAGLQSFELPTAVDPDAYFQGREWYHSIRLLQNGAPWGLAGIAWNQMMLAATQAQYRAAKAMFPQVFDGNVGTVQVTLPVVSVSG